MTAQSLEPPLQPLYRTAPGQRLHVPGCPHVASTVQSLQPATTLDRLALPVCTWCQSELDCQGRTYYPTLDDALRAFGYHDGTHRPIRQALRFVHLDDIWLPHSASYVALGLDGRIVAGINKGFVSLKATGAVIELPGYRTSAGGGSPADLRWGATCEQHFVARSLAGRCDLCDE